MNIRKLNRILFITFIIHLIPLLKVLFINVRIYLIRILKLSLIIYLKNNL